jgi:ribonuclease HI
MGASGEKSDDADGRLARVCALELRLLDPRVDPLLHRDFREIGGSGRVWDKTTVLAALAADPGPPPEVSELKAEWLTRDAALVTYRAHGPGGTASLRTSVWVRDAGAWRVRFHQGTPAAAQDGDAAQEGRSGSA